VIGECADGEQAVDDILRLRPDVVFLDVQMPGLDGFGVIEAVGADRMPVTIFVTAYDLYALKAFDAHAIDYLLKPISPKRFEAALQKARAMTLAARNAEYGKTLTQLLNAVNKQTQYPQRLIVKSIGRNVVIPLDTVEYIEAEGDYARVQTPGKAHLLRETMSSLAARLDPGIFARIHRSTIVRLSAIKELRPISGGDYEVFLVGSKRFVLSRKHKDVVLERLEAGVSSERVSIR
jgi:two-component system LytT family response regulator